MGREEQTELSLRATQLSHSELMGESEQKCRRRQLCRQLCIRTRLLTALLMWLLKIQTKSSPTNPRSAPALCESSALPPTQRPAAAPAQLALEELPPAASSQPRFLTGYSISSFLMNVFSLCLPRGTGSAKLCSHGRAHPPGTAALGCGSSAPDWAASAPVLHPYNPGMQHPIFYHPALTSTPLLIDSAQVTATDLPSALRFPNGKVSTGAFGHRSQTQGLGSCAGLGWAQ